MKGKRDVRYWNWQDKVWNSNRYYAGTDILGNV